jgi:hypothetical protein
MSATTADLMDDVLPRHCGLRQWVLTFPFAWRPALGRDGALLGSLTRIFEQTVQGFYARRAREEGHPGAKTGCVTALQRVSSDLRLDLRPEPQAKGRRRRRGGAVGEGVPPIRTSTPCSWTAPGTSRRTSSPSSDSGI